MMSVIYAILSSIAVWLFVTIMNPVVTQLERLNQALEASLDETPRKVDSIADENDSSLVFQDSITVAPVPTASPVSQFGSENYVVEPVGDGMYRLHNVPAESMATVSELIQAVNTFRASHGLSSLEVDSHLCDFASRRAQEVDSEFSHQKFSEHLDNGIADNWGFSHFGENLWQGSMMGVHIVEYGWAKSPGHYAALVGDWTKGCAGIYNTSAVFIFAR